MEEFKVNPELQKYIDEYKASCLAMLKAKMRLHKVREFIKEELKQAEIDREGSQDHGGNESGRWLV